MTHFYDSSVLGVHYLHVLGSNSSAQTNSHHELPTSFVPYGGSSF